MPGTGTASQLTSSHGLRGGVLQKPSIGVGAATQWAAGSILTAVR